MHTTLDQTAPLNPGRLLGIQAIVAFNDNFAKFALLGLIATTLTAQQGELFTTLTAALLVAPFIILAPMASWLTGKFSRERVIHGCLIAQLLICLGLATTGIFESVTGVLVAFGLLACQSACFSPAKQAIIKEWVGPTNLGKWVAWMGLSSVVGILFGAAIGGAGFDILNSYMSPFDAFKILSTLLAANAFGSLLFFRKYKNLRGAFVDQISSPQEPGTIASTFKTINRNGDLRIGALGISAFYAFGGFLLVCLSQIVRNESPETAAGTAGLFSANLGIGFILGSLLMGHLQRKRIADFITPLASALISLATLALYFHNSIGDWLQNLCLIVIGFSGAGLVLPLQSLVQSKTDDQERGPIISQINALTNILSISLLGLHAIANSAGIPYRLQLAVSAAFILGLAGCLFLYFWKTLIITVARAIARCIYKVRVKGSQHLPREGGVLLVANHLSWADAVIVSLASPREVTFMGSADLLRNKWIRFVFDLFNVIPVSPRAAREAIKSAQQALKNGQCVCIFPEGGISQTGMLLSLKKGAILIARQANAVVVPVYLDRLWGSIFSYSDNKFFKKRPRNFPYKVNVRFGERIRPQEIETDRLRDEFHNLSCLCMTDRVDNQPHILETALSNLKNGRGPTIIDRTVGRKTISNRKLLALSIHLSNRIKEVSSKNRVGFALPMGAISIASNIASHISGKVPVFLNTTTSAETWKSYTDTADFDTILTVSKLEQAVRSRAPEHVQVVSIDNWLKLSKSDGLIALIKALIISVKQLTRHANKDEATILFTSGSSGTPKGVKLSPRNIQANCLQVQECAALRSDDRILVNLPPFHSFGYTMGCWMPLISGNTLITTPNPLDSKTTGTAIEEESATLFLATPTFLRPYIKKADPKSLKSLRAVIAGAERLPETLQAAWESKFGSEILLGYGMTEASPVISLNVPDPVIRDGKGEPWRNGKCANSSGRLLPGIRARLIDPETGNVQHGSGRGILEVQGPNVSAGYIQNEDANKERFRDGWLHTGDIVRIDENGFLFIEGRISRFAKVGGEMVPLDAVERKIEEAFLKLGRNTNIAITTSKDEQRGEKLVLFSEELIDSSELRKILASESIPNLWIPRNTIHLSGIPKLASGKTNYNELTRTCDLELSA